MRRTIDAERGFTLVELMVVVAIIGILAAIGVPQMTKFIKNAQTAQPISQSGHIEKAIRGYVDAHPNVTVADLEGAIGGTTVVAECADNCLSAVIPEVEVASDHEWTYTIGVAIDADRVSWVCIQAFETDGGSAADAIYYSTRQSTNPLWNNHTYVQPYVSGAEFEVGGSCSAAAPTATVDSNDP